MGQELAAPVPVAAGEVADARGRVDREGGVGVEPTREPAEVVLVAPEVAAGHAQLGVAGEDPGAGLERHSCFVENVSAELEGWPWPRRGRRE